MFGQVQYIATDKHWAITCEPFVRTRLKRLFPRAPQGAAHYISLSASPENTRELEWFLERYPMEISGSDAERMKYLAEHHRTTEVARTALLSGYTPPVDITLAEPAREYQVLAAQLLSVCDGYILADDVGLGKTVSAIAAAVLQGKYPVLVVCPAHLPQQWQNMFKRFAPSLVTHILKKSQPYDLSMKPKRQKKNLGQADLLPAAQPDVIITSYHKLRGWAEELEGKAKLVVFDECQQLRSDSSEIYRASKLVAYSAEKRLGLSATPIYNYGEEFFPVINVIAPGALGERAEFLREWCTAHHEDGKSRLGDAREFGAYLRREGLMLRRTRAEVGRELPPLEKVVHEIQADPMALEKIKGNAVQLARTVLRAGEAYRGEKMQAAGEFDNIMRQATGIAKAPYVAEFVRLLLESGEPVVLYGWHRTVYEIWLEALAEFNPVLYSGSESASQKEEAVRKFKSGESRLLILSLRSGAGLDGLQDVCSVMVFGELDWSPGVHVQCMGRPHRDGQTNPCIAYFLVSDQGADPIMTDVLGIKREQIENVTNPDTALAERIETGEGHLRELAKQFLAKHAVGELEDCAM